MNIVLVVLMMMVMVMLILPVLENKHVVIAMTKNDMAVVMIWIWMVTRALKPMVSMLKTHGLRDHYRHHHRASFLKESFVQDPGGF